MSSRIAGAVVLPPDTPETVARRIVVEARDVSLLDAPSSVIARIELVDVRLSASARIPFVLDVPRIEASRSLSLRVHVDLDGDGRVSPGDYLSTTSTPLPAEGADARILIPVTRI